MDHLSCVAMNDHFFEEDGKKHKKRLSSTCNATKGKPRFKLHTAGEVTEDNEKSLSSGWNFLDRFKLQPQVPKKLRFSEIRWTINQPPSVYVHNDTNIV